MLSEVRQRRTDVSQHKNVIPGWLSASGITSMASDKQEIQKYSFDYDIIALYITF